MRQPSYACSWYAYRWNIVPFGAIGYTLASHFADSLACALFARTMLTWLGAEDVRVYDTVDGIFEEVA